MLILKRNPDAKYSESYNVLFEGRHGGRIYKAVPHARRWKRRGFGASNFTSGRAAMGRSTRLRPFLKLPQFTRCCLQLRLSLAPSVDGAVR